MGKTSLVKKLTTGKFRTREKPTEGIKIVDWPCPFHRKQFITTHIWDFGGQEIMHATHQFFLTTRSLYVLVLEREKMGTTKKSITGFALFAILGTKRTSYYCIEQAERCPVRCKSRQAG